MSQRTKQKQKQPNTSIVNYFCHVWKLLIKLFDMLNLFHNPLKIWIFYSQFYQKKLRNFVILTKSPKTYNWQMFSKLPNMRTIFYSNWQQNIRNYIQPLLQQINHILIQLNNSHLNCLELIYHYLFCKILTLVVLCDILPNCQNRNSCWIIQKMLYKIHYEYSW